MAGPSVVGGVIQRLSPSRIETFDFASTWGCEVKWFFQEVLGFESPPTPALKLGDETHAEIEAYLKGQGNGMGKVALSAKGIIDSVAPHIVQIENWMSPKITLRGIVCNGRIDIELKRGSIPGILDWKTCSDIGRYAKNREELKDSIQLLIYAWWLLQQHQEANVVTVELIYMQTRGRRAEQVGPVELTRAYVTDQIENRILPIVDRMIVAAKAKGPEELTPSLDKCKMAQGCEHRVRCPHFQKAEQEQFDNDPLFADVKETTAPFGGLFDDPTPSSPDQKESNSMGIMDDLFGDAPTAPATTPTPPAQPAPQQKVETPAAPVKPPVPALTQAEIDANTALIEAHKAKVAAEATAAKAAELAAQLAAQKAALTAPAAPLQSPVPADAPPSKPELAADPMPTNAPAADAPAKRGRPKKDAMKIVDAAPTSSPAPTTAATAPVAGFSVTRVVVTKGLTINLGNFESARVEVSMEAVGSEAEANRAKLGEMVKAALREEAKAYFEAAKARAAEGKK